MKGKSHGGDGQSLLQTDARIVKMLRSSELGRFSSQELIIPGLPDEVAINCLARVGEISSLWGVCSVWQSILYTSEHFHKIRSGLHLPGFTWLYTMIAQPQDAQKGSFSFSWYAFDPLAGIWHPLPPMPPDVRFVLSRPGFLGPYKHSIQCTSTTDKLIVIAGTKSPDFASKGRKNPRARLEDSSVSRLSALESALDSPLVFDVASATWKRGPRYTVARRWCSCGATRGKVLVASGCGNGWDADTARSAEVWDTTTMPPRWREVGRLASTKLSREATSAVDLAGRLHMASARSGAVFDAASETWLRMAPGMARGWNGACVASRGKLLVVDDTGGRVRAYDSSTDTWVSVLYDERVKNLGNVVAVNGRIFGSVNGLIRVLELGDEGAHFREIKLPVEGQVVAMQLLSSFVTRIVAAGKGN